MTDEKRRGWIATLRDLPRALERTLAALPPGALDTPYRDGGWTVRQVAHHLADSHMNAYCRLRLALTEDTPLIKTYEEQRWAELPDARQGEVAPSLAILSGVHARLTELLESLPADRFARQARHPAWGEITVDWLLQMYAWHSRHHLGHIELVARAAVGR